MKYIWEDYDFQGDRTAHGMMVTRGDSLENFMLGYTGGTGKSIALISMRDGMVMDVGDPAEAAKHLNSFGYVPLFAHLSAEQKINLCLPPAGE